MSITITHQPQAVTPVYNDMMFVVGSTLATQPYFKMIVKLYNSGTLLKTLKYDKWPHGNYIQADVHRMLESSLSYNITNLATGQWGFKKVPESFVNYKVEFIEEINNVPVSSGMVTASGLYAFNGALKYLDWINYDYTNYDIQESYQRSFLTNAPRALAIREGESAELGFFSTGSVIINVVYRAEIITYDWAGNVLQTASIYNSFNPHAAAANKFLSFMCGPFNLNAATLDEGAQPLITGNVAKYTVQLWDSGSPGASSETFTFIIDRECSRHQLFRLHFLNRWGRFDSFTFKGSHKQSINFKRSEYQKFTGYTDLNTMEWTNNSYARGLVTFDTVETAQYTISTGWITEEESEWLQELVGSAAVYWQTDPADNTKTIAVNITDANYEVKKYANKKLFSLTITMQLAQPNYRQRV